MKILGVDPGLRVTGYGLIRVPDTSFSDEQIELIEAGVIRARADLGIAARLQRIYEGLWGLVTEQRPDVLVIEKLYAHTKHPATAILMGHARGAVCLLSGVLKVPLVSIAATHVKKAVTGQGHAGKAQMQRMVQHTLGLKCLPEPPDVADALALAISYALGMKKRVRV